MSFKQPSFRNVRIGKTLELKSGALIGFNGVTPTGVASAYTQTYSTAARTVANATGAAVSTAGGTATSPFGYVTLAQANAIVTAVNALVDDVLADKKVINALIDDLQGVGISG